MIPRTYKLVAIPNFGGEVTVTVEGRPYKIDPTDGELLYGPADVLYIAATATTDLPVESAAQDNSTDLWHEIQGNLRVDGTGAVSGTCELRLIRVGTTIESDQDRGQLLTVLEIPTGDANPQDQFFSTEDPF